MEIKNKKSILATLDEIIENSKYKVDGISEERTRELYIKDEFHVAEQPSLE